MSEGGLIEAWGIWATGMRLDNYLLWGHSVLWWGRFGKIIEVVATLTIIAEIVGPVRIREFGKSLHSKITLTDALNSMHHTWMWKKFMIAVTSGFYGRASDRTTKYQTDKRTPVTIVVGLAASVGLLVLLLPQIPPETTHRAERYIGLLIALLFVLAFILSIFLVSLSSFAISVAGIIIDFLVIEPLAWIIDRESLDRWIKTVSIILLLIGLHFDILSS